MKKNTVFADLHVHSTASDGTLSPANLVKLGVEKGLRVLGLTDHDTFKGVEEAFEASRGTDLEIIPGIELSCGWEDRDSSVHVLGLFISLRGKRLCSILNEQQDSRYRRAFRIIDLLEKAGVDMSELREEFEKVPDKVLGRPHLARFLLEKGHIKSFQEAFDRYLSRGKPAYVPKDHLSPEDGIEAIHDAGGLAILAHPGLLPDWDFIWSRIGELDWDGMETYYSEHRPSQVRFFEKIVAERNWISSGGSDYHGDYGKHTNRLGKYGLNEEQYNALRKFAENR